MTTFKGVQGSSFWPNVRSNSSIEPTWSKTEELQQAGSLAENLPRRRRFCMIARGSCAMVFSALVLFAVGCGGNSTLPQPPPCVPASTPQFAYLLTGFSVSMFTVNSCTGAFTATTPATIPTGPQSSLQGSEDMVVDRSGRFVYVANLVSNVAGPSAISMYTINATTGVLTPTTPASVAAGWSPLSITVDPSGRFAYAANQDDGTISMYTINGSTGVLTPMTPASVNAGGSPFAFAVTPSGKFAYMVDNLFDRVVQYTIDQTTGTLIPVTPVSAPTGKGPTAVVVDPSSKFAYVTNRLDNTLSMFTIDSNTGALNANGIIATGSLPFRVAFDPSGKYVYVVNGQSQTSVYTIDSSGKLTNPGTTGLPALQLAMH